jgi:hypothetical protein
MPILTKKLAMNQDQDPFKGQPIIINEGTLKKNMNPPPTTERPPAPKAQVAPLPQPSTVQKTGG